MANNKTVYFIIILVTVFLIVFSTNKFFQTKLSMVFKIGNFNFTNRTDKEDGLLSENIKRLFIPYYRENAKQIGAQNCTKVFKSKHLMTIEKPMGRLGNNLFQLIVLLGTSISHCYTPVMTNELYDKLRNTFDLSTFERMPKVPHHWKVFQEHLSTAFSSEIQTLDQRFNWTLAGYFQSWRYFEEHGQLIRSILHFRKHLSEPVIKYINSTVEFRNKSTVCVHHRRGDFLTEAHQRVGFGVATIGFLNKAMDYFVKKLNSTSVVFIYLSDDIKWCKENVKRDNVFFSPFSSPGKLYSAGCDLALMSYCDHSIVTSGSFGWLGAWLGNGHVVYFKGFPTPGSPKDLRMNRTDYYPPNWVGMM